MSAPSPRQPSPAQAASNRQAYIPPDVRAAMTQHVEQSMPAHLKQYQNSGSYVPEHAQAAITEHLQKSLPAHMQQYVGAYVQQNVMSPHTVTPNAALESSPEFIPHAPGASFGPQDHFHPSEEQQIVQPAAPTQPEHVSPEQAFDFIMNPEQPVNKQRLPGGNSMAMRLLVVLGGLLVLLIIFSVFKNLLSGGSNLNSLVAVTQDQQELIHLTNNASSNTQSSLSSDDQNFTATAQLSLTSVQAGLFNYLKINGTKPPSPSVLNLKVSRVIDNQLTAAITADTYDQTFQQVMKNQLSQYQTDLNNAYKATAGAPGRALLKSDYHQAQLLTTQLDSASTN